MSSADSVTTEDNEARDQGSVAAAERALIAIGLNPVDAEEDVLWFLDALAAEGYSVVGLIPDDKGIWHQPPMLITGASA